MHRVPLDPAGAGTQDSSMADQWYFADDEYLHGPLTLAELRRCAQEGKLLPEHWIRQGEAGAWQRAGGRDVLSFGPPRIPARGEVSRASAGQSLPRPHRRLLKPNDWRLLGYCVVTLIVAGVLGAAALELLRSGRASAMMDDVAAFLSASAGPMIVFLFVLVAVLVYFLPTFVAASRGHHQYEAILVLNLFLGWTFLGWVLALVWAYTATRGRRE